MGCTVGRCLQRACLHIETQQLHNALQMRLAWTAFRWLAAPASRFDMPWSGSSAQGNPLFLRAGCMYAIALGSPGKVVQDAWEDKVVSKSWAFAMACGAAGRHSQAHLQKQVSGRGAGLGGLQRCLEHCYCTLHAVPCHWHCPETAAGPSKAGAGESCGTGW